MTDELESWEEAEARPLEQHPDVLKRKPVDVSEKDWAQYQTQVKEITNGIWYPRLTLRSSSRSVRRFSVWWVLRDPGLTRMSVSRTRHPAQPSGLPTRKFRIRTIPTSPIANIERRS